MKRTAIAAAWIAGVTVPLLVSVVFVFGCCVLPFHGVIHKFMPLCNVAIDFMRGEQHEHQQAPVPEKQQPVKRIALEMPRAFHSTIASTAQRSATPSAATAYRSFISLGAIRCDQDIGLHLFVATMLI